MARRGKYKENEKEIYWKEMERQLREGEGLETETPLHEKLIHTVVAKLYKV